MAQLWFKFWAKDYLGDGKIGCLSYEKRGMLQTLWAYAWEEGSIPADPELLAELLKLSPRAMRSHSIWIGQFFHPSPQDPSRLISPRLEMERMEATDRGAKAQEAALIRWSKRNANADADALLKGMPKPCTGDAIQSTEKDSTPQPPTGGIAEPADTTPVLLQMPCQKGRSWPLTEGRMAKWREAFPHLDVMQEVRKMQLYLETPPNRKTLRGMDKFTLGWLGRARPTSGRASPGRVMPLRPSPGSQGPSPFPELPRIGEA